jgi:hypothetical protein
MMDPSTHPVTTDDLERDAVLHQRISLFGWVREKHLDVPEGEASQGFLAFAEQGMFDRAPVPRRRNFLTFSPKNCSRSTTTKRRGIR